MRFVKPWQTAFVIVMAVELVGAVAFAAWVLLILAREWLTDHVNGHRRTEWRIGSDRTGRSFVARATGVSFVLRSGGPTRALLWMRSERDS